MFNAHNLTTGLSRRQMLKGASAGFGYLALAGLLAEAQAAEALSSAAPSPAAQALAAKAGHHSAKAKHIIFLFMQGAPSHVDTFDYKPRLETDHGQLDPSGTGRKFMQSPWEFKQHGQSGLRISSLFPEVAKHADKLCLLHGLHTDIPNHPQATLQMHTGSFRFARPSLGAWVLYGLGTENQDLPGFLAINPLGRVGGAQNYGAAFLPSDYQATRIGSEGQNLAKAALAHIANSRLDTSAQREQLQLVRSLHESRPAAVADAELDSVIASYELAFRMQATAPTLLNLDGESTTTLEQYGLNDPATEEFGRQCLLARRSVEAGVRFVELSSTGWDHHNNLRTALPNKARSIDKPIGALLADLEARGLLKDTLVLWGGEFGRTPAAQNDNGRDHNATGFTMWLAGAGVKPGISYGSTDEHGVSAAEGKLHVHDLHATLLHLLGLNHERLTYRYSGRDFRLTDVYGTVAQDILL